MPTPEEIVRHHERRLAFETDVADAAAALRDGADPPVVLDVRSRAAYARAHVPGALCAPHAELDADAVAALPDGPVVVYCWGPACNGAQRGALAVARHGREVKEMIGGFEYWVREGLAVDGEAADAFEPTVDPLTSLPPGSR